jgi:hypothetical protein
MKNTAIWYNYDLTNEKNYTRAVKHIQKMVRQSMSYDSWQKRSKIGISECPICNISSELVKMESHHYPKTLFDVVDDYLQMQIDFDKIDELTDFDVAQEIMNQHYDGTVNYVVLCEYCHKKYHDDVPEILEVIDECWRKQHEARNQRKGDKK